MFDRLTRADWSKDAHKRWAATAERHAGHWRVGSPALVRSIPSFLCDAFKQGDRERVLLGFDFPIGVPAAYGIQTGFLNFKDALLPVLGTAAWEQFFDVASRPDEVSLRRPFYPRSSMKGVRKKTLVEGLGMQTFDDLLRVCDRGPRIGGRHARCSGRLEPTRLARALSLGGGKSSVRLLNGVPGCGRSMARWPNLPERRVS